MNKLLIGSIQEGNRFSTLRGLAGRRERCDIFIDNCNARWKIVIQYEMSGYKVLWKLLKGENVFSILEGRKSFIEKVPF